MELVGLNDHHTDKMCECVEFLTVYVDYVWEFRLVEYSMLTDIKYGIKHNRWLIKTLYLMIVHYNELIDVVCTSDCLFVHRI